MEDAGRCESQDESSRRRSAARASLSLDLPPGVAVAGGRRTLTADIDYTLQPAADGSGDGLLLRNADAIVTPLATLARVAQPPQAPRRRRPPTQPADAPQRRPRASPRPQSADSRARHRLPPIAGRPSFNCRQRADPRRARGVRRSAACRARPQHGGAISRALADGRSPTSGAAAADARPLPRLSRPLPSNAVHRRHLSRPDARDPRHHGRPLATAAISWG